MWKNRRAQNKDTFVRIYSCYCVYEDATFIKPKTHMQLGFSNGTCPITNESQLYEDAEIDGHLYRAQQLYGIYLNL